MNYSSYSLEFRWEECLVFRALGSAIKTSGSSIEDRTSTTLEFVYVSVHKNQCFVSNSQYMMPARAGSVFRV